MVMINIHIASITCLVTNDALHAYEVIVVYKIHHVAGRSDISRNRQYCGWVVRLWARLGPVAYKGDSDTVVGLQGYGRGRAHNRGVGMPPGQ